MSVRSPPSHVVTERRVVPATYTIAGYAGRASLPHPRAGQHAAFVVLASGFKDWGYGSSPEEAEADGMRRAQALASHQERR